MSTLEPLASDPIARQWASQAPRRAALLAATPTMGAEVRSEVLPFTLDLTADALTPADERSLVALEKVAARTAIDSLVSLAKVKDIDHLGGGLELVGPLLMTLAAVDYRAKHFAIEHGHTSIGYYAALSALGFLDRDRVVDGFRRSLDIAGHVSWVPGGTPLGSGRLGVMMPVGTGLALASKAHYGDEAMVFCHTGDAGWVSGQSLNGMTAASLHGAPITFVMHRNGIQLSGPTAQVLDRDPRPIVRALGLEVLEIPSLHDRPALFRAYAEAYRLGRAGKPSLIYPVGYQSRDGDAVTVETFGRQYGIGAETLAFAEAHGVALQTPVWIPGSLMSFRDAEAMLQCLFYVNALPGGEAHHDGGMKGRDADRTLASPMLQLGTEDIEALSALGAQPRRIVVTTARPAKGAPNLVIDTAELTGVKLPPVGEWVSARAGSEAAYAELARRFPDRCFFTSCDLDPSTKLGKAAALVATDHKFELGIQEQAATLLTGGLSFAQNGPQLNVFATFAAFMEGIAREGFEFWRYQRNLNGANEGLNVLLHLSHVGACTGRDHFSGWSLDWVNLALGYLPFLRRVYAPADARAAFVAVRDAAAGMGGHIVTVPRDSLPVLALENGQPAWNAGDAWTPVTELRRRPGARVAVLALGAPAYLAVAASDTATNRGVPTDVHCINGFPLADGWLASLRGSYDRIVTIEDGLIGDPQSGARGFAGLVSSTLAASGIALDHFGIVDPQVAPSEHFVAVWEYFGMTEANLVDALMGTAQKG